MGSQVREFERYCRDRGLEFETLSRPHSDHAEVRFSGHFHQQPVIWHARIMTLEYYRTQRADPQLPEGRRQFIAVGDEGDGERHIDIALRTTAIDTPTILKTMIMVRQWKNLDYGIHEFGPD